MQQWINHAERKQKKKPRSASLIRLISKAIYLCGDYVGILLAEWIAFHIRNFLMGNIFQVNAIYIYIVTPAVFLLALAFAGIYSKHYTSAQMLEKLFKACLGNCFFHHPHVPYPGFRPGIPSVCRAFCGHRLPVPGS